MANLDTDRDVRERDRTDRRDDLNYRDRDYRDRDRKSYDDDRDGDRGVADRDRNRPHTMMVTTTETRNAFLTTEFWLALIAAAAVIAAGYWDEGKLLVSQGWALGCGIIAFYVLSRGIAKAGSHDPKIKELD
jgi:hypothetical protein